MRAAKETKLRIGSGLRAAMLALALLVPAGLALGATAEVALETRAAAGDSEAQFELARLYATGREGVEKDQRQAARWFQRAAEQGDARAQVNLGVMYEKGRGVPKDDAAAVDWITRAANQKHPRAMYLLGVRFEKGRGVPQSPVLAYVWLKRAADLGSPAGQVKVKQLESRLSESDRAAARRLYVHQHQIDLEKRRAEAAAAAQSAQP